MVLEPSRQRPADLGKQRMRHLGDNIYKLWCHVTISLLCCCHRMQCENFLPSKLKRRILKRPYHATTHCPYHDAARDFSVVSTDGCGCDDAPNNISAVMACSAVPNTANRIVAAQIRMDCKNPPPAFLC